MNRRTAITLLVLAALTVLVIWARLAVGGELVEGILGLRIERVVCGVIVGVALSVGGVMLQSLLRNPLASPDLLGLSAGAGFAVVLAMYVGGAVGLGSAAFLGAGWQAAPALVGSLAALAVVYVLSQRGGMVDPASLILIGVMISVMCGAGSRLVQHLFPTRIDIWRSLMGGLVDGTPHSLLIGGGVVVAAGFVIGVWAGRTMDALALSDDEAISVGVPLGRARLILFCVSGVLAAAAVVLAGPVGFVGLVCPHVVRLSAGPSHRPLVIGAAMAGAILVVGADALVVVLKTSTGRIPLGVITALIGGPVFIVLLRRGWSTPV